MIAWMVAAAFVLQLFGMAAGLNMSPNPATDVQTALLGPFADFPICSGSPDKKGSGQQPGGMPCPDHFNCPLCHAATSPMLTADTIDWLPVRSAERVALVATTERPMQAGRRAGYVSRGPPVAA